MSANKREEPYTGKYFVFLPDGRKCPLPKWAISVFMKAISDKRKEVMRMGCKTKKGGGVKK